MTLDTKLVSVAGITSLAYVFTISIPLSLSLTVINPVFLQIQITVFVAVSYDVSGLAC